MGQLRAAILVVSDTASRDPSTDKSGNILTETFAESGGDSWAKPITKIVQDDVLEIQRSIQAWTDGPDDYINLIVTTGGTGFARQDFTPEAVEPLLHRHAPGLVHGMLSASLQVTPFAMMSRPVAGVRNRTVIMTLPGSPKGAKENLEAVLKLLPHACMQAAGEDSRAAHVGGVQKLEKDAGISAILSRDPAAPARNHNHSHSHHDHSHGDHSIPKAHTKPSTRSNDPSIGASHRARESPYPIVSVPEAIALIHKHTPPPIPITTLLTPSLVGNVVARDIHARESVPAYRASIVDGYAVIVSPSSSTKGTFPVTSVSHAQATSMPPPLQPGQIARITTGAPLPDNANAVVMVEDTLVSSMTDDQREEKEVEVLTDEIVVGENVREAGSDIQLNSLILRTGQRISSVGGAIGVLAASGIREVPVYLRPRVGVMSTGDEVVDISFAGGLSGGMIRDSNRPSLLSLISSWGLCEDVVDLGIARDTPNNELEEKIRGGFRTHALDVIVTTGGVSMGELDLLKPTVERALGGQIYFGRVSMKPGKPTTFAGIPFKSPDSGKKEQKLVFGLPGNPASAIVTSHLFLLPCLQRLCGLEGKGPEKIRVKVQEKVKCDPQRVEYHRVVVSCSQEGGLLARSTGMQRSSRVGSLASANALLVLPLKQGFVEVGEDCEALMMGPILGF